MARLKRRTTRRTVKRRRPTLRRGRRVYKRRVYRRRRYTRRFRRARLSSQPNVVTLKNKLVCSIVEFQSLPVRDSLPQIITMASFTTKDENGISNVTQENKAAFSALGQMFYNVYSVDTANGITVGENASYSTSPFIAWNPYVDYTLLGSLWNSYILMYEYWKVVGVKIKWIPSVKTSTAIPIMPVSYKASQRRIEGTYTGSTQIGGSFTGAATQAGEDVIVYPDDDSKLGYKQQVTLNMHVLFEKDNYENYDLPTDPSSVAEDQVCKDTRYKFKRFFYGPSKPKTYKVYDMTRPFKFYVKPYMQNTSTEITDDNKTPQTGTTLSNPSLDAQINVKKRMRYVKFNGTKNELLGTEITKAQIYANNIQDQNYFDPILFGYFFTANGLAVNQYITTAKNHPPTSATAAWNSYSLYAPANITAMGKFEVTFYTRFKQIKNTN